MPVPTKSITS